MPPPTNASANTLNAFLERVYPDEIVANDIYGELPELALANKVELDGDRYVIKVKIAGQQGRSSDYVKAVNNRTSSAGQEFLVTDSDDYATGGIENKAILTLAGNKNEFKKALTKEMDSSKASMFRSFANAFYAPDNGSIGRIVNIAGAVITIDVNNQKYFHPGQILQASTSPTLGAPDRVATGEVLKVDRISGIVTLVGAPALWANGDYLYIDGDYRARPMGFLAWGPKTVTSTAFYGVDRTLARLELAGSYYDLSKGASTDEVLDDAFAWAGDLGQDVDTLIMNPVRFNALAKSLKDRSQYSMGQVNSPDRPHIGFKTITWTGPKGKPLEIVSSPWCPKTYSPAFKRSELTLAYRGKNLGKSLPALNDFDGMKVRRSRAVANVTEWELFAHWCIAFENPMNLMNIEY